MVSAPMQAPCGWLPYLVPVLVIEISCVFVYFLWPQIKRSCNKDKFTWGRKTNVDQGLLRPLNNFDGLGLSGIGGGETAVGTTADVGRIFPPVHFEETYLSVTPCFQYLLLCTRMASFVFFVSIGIAYNVVSEGNFDMHFFTNWNVLLVTFYFTLALSCSVLGYWDCCAPKYGPTGGWSPTHQRVAVVLNFLFELTGSTAFLITTVNFSLLDPEMTLENVACHLATTAAFLAEMFLSKFRVTPIHYPFVLLWYVLYMCVIWPWVLTETPSGNDADWPYPFLSLTDWACFLWYSGLLLGSGFFFALWSSLAVIKQKLHASYIQSLELRLKEMHDNRAVAFLEQVNPYGARAGIRGSELA